MGHADIQCLVTAAENAFLRVADAKQQLWKTPGGTADGWRPSPPSEHPQRKIQTLRFRRRRPANARAFWLMSSTALALTVTWTLEADPSLVVLPAGR